MVAAFLTGGNAAAWTASGLGDEFLRRWAPGHARGDRDGADWDITGYGIPSYWPPMKHFDSLAPGAAATATAPATGVDLIHFVLPADSVVLVTGDRVARGLLGLADGDRALGDVMGKSLCTKQGGCACPDGAPGNGANLPVVGAGPGYLGVTGGLAPATVTLTVTSLNDYCAKPPTACVVGSWTLSNADLTVGAPPTHETGGAGMRMTIGADGATTIDFSPMQPVKFTSTLGGGMEGQITYTGAVTYRLGLPAEASAQGALTYLGGDLSQLRASARITKPFDLLVIDNASVLGLASDVAGVSLNMQPLAGSHTYECTPSTLVLRPPAGGGLSGTWTFARG
jgi:hypothetical protein